MFSRISSRIVYKLSWKLEPLLFRADYTFWPFSDFLRIKKVVLLDFENKTYPHIILLSPSSLLYSVILWIKSFYDSTYVLPLFLYLYRLHNSCSLQFHIKWFLFKRWSHGTTVHYCSFGVTHWEVMSSLPLFFSPFLTPTTRVMSPRHCLLFHDHYQINGCKAYQTQTVKRTFLSFLID